MVFGAIVISLVTLIGVLLYIIHVLRTDNEFNNKTTKRRRK